VKEKQLQQAVSVSAYRGALPRRRRAWLLAVAAALLLQSLFPSGYMPGSLSGGWLAVICPEGLPTAFVQQLAGEGGHQHHHSSHSGEGDDASASHHGSDSPVGSCQLGSALDQPGDLAQNPSVPGSVDPVASVSPHAAIRLTNSTTLSPPSRGPPVA
jgi:hypothetical protein